MEQMTYIALALAFFVLSEAVALKYVTMPRVLKTTKTNALVWGGTSAVFLCAFVFIAQI